MQVRNGKYIDLFLEALPIITFWLRIVVAQSHARGKEKQVGTSCLRCQYVHNQQHTHKRPAAQPVLARTTPL